MSDNINLNLIDILRKHKINFSVLFTDEGPDLIFCNVINSQDLVIQKYLNHQNDLLYSFSWENKTGFEIIRDITFSNTFKLDSELKDLSKKLTKCLIESNALVNNVNSDWISLFLKFELIKIENTYYSYSFN